MLPQEYVCTNEVAPGVRCCCSCWLSPSRPCGGPKSLLQSDSKSGAASASQSAERRSPPNRPRRDADQSSDPLKRPADREQQKKANSKALKQELSGTYKKWLNEDVAVHHHAGREVGVQAAVQRRGARPVHRAVLAAPRSHARHSGERIQGRALSPHRLRQRAFCARAFPAGKPIAGASTSSGDRRTRSSRIPPAAPTTARMEEGGGTTTTYPFERLALPLSGRRRPGSRAGVCRSPAPAATIT